jgi:hypothetical protein
MSWVYKAHEETINAFTYINNFDVASSWKRQRGPRMILKRSPKETVCDDLERHKTQFSDMLF